MVWDGRGRIRPAVGGQQIGASEDLLKHQLEHDVALLVEHFDPGSLLLSEVDDFKSAAGFTKAANGRAASMTIGGMAAGQTSTKTQKKRAGTTISTRRRCDMIDVHLIRTEDDYRAALARVDKLMEAEAGTPDGDELEHLAMVIEAYENKHHPIGLPDPIAAIHFRMDQEGLSNKDLIPYIGSSAKVSEVLAGKRDLTLPMIRALHKHLGMPAEVLIQEPGGIIPDDTGTGTDSR